MSIRELNYYSNSVKELEMHLIQYSSDLIAASGHAITFCILLSQYGITKDRNRIHW